MRKSIVIAVSLLFVVASAFAQQHATPANAVSVFVSELSVTHDSSNTNVDASYGAAFEHMFNKRVSAELSVTAQRTRLTSTSFGPADQPVFTLFTKTLYPVDATVSYHFFNGSRWKPYLGAGLRYVSSSIQNTGQFDTRRFTSRTIYPEISGGVVFQFRPALGLRFDAKELTGHTNSSVGNSSLSGSVGLSFRF